MLVVGGGNTGFQIAHELAATHEVHLAIGSRQAPLPQRLFGRDLFTILTATGLMGKTVDSRLGRRLSGRDALIGSSPRAIRRRGVHVRPRATGAAGSTITFADESTLDARTVIWATGFGVDYSYVDAPVFSDDGAVIHTRGVTAAPGLYFLGMPWQHTRGSALLGWVKDDAGTSPTRSRRTHRGRPDAGAVRREAGDRRTLAAVRPTVRSARDLASTAAGAAGRTHDRGDRRQQRHRLRSGPTPGRTRRPRGLGGARRRQGRGSRGAVHRLGRDEHRHARASDLGGSRALPRRCWIVTTACPL